MLQVLFEKAELPKYEGEGLPFAHTFDIIRLGMPALSKVNMDLVRPMFTSVLHKWFEKRLEKVEENNEYWDERGFIQDKKLNSRVHLNRDLYCLFWHADLKDLLVPTKFYEK